MDKIFLKGIEVLAVHGVLEDERKQPQPFEIDISVYGDFQEAASDDLLSLSVDYSQLGELAVEVATSKSFNLIESLAREIAERALSLDRVLEVEVTVRKMMPPVQFPVRYAGVTLRRTIG